MTKSRMGRWAVSLGILAGLSLPIPCEQLYVRNRPYKGVVIRNSGQLWVELSGFAQALGARLEQNAEGGIWVHQAADAALETPVAAGKVVIGSQEVEAQNGADGQVLVPMEVAARLLGARVIPNKSLGTIDVSLVAASKPGESTTSTPRPMAEAPSGPILKDINKAGSAVEITAHLVPGRINIVDFGAEW